MSPKLTLAVLFTILVLPAAATAALREPVGTMRASQLECEFTATRPLALVRMWLETEVQGLRAPCDLTATGFHPSEPPFGHIAAAEIERLATVGNRGHQLYRVLLANRTKAVTYIIGLKPRPGHQWVIELWTET